MAKANKIEIRLTDAEKASCQEQATAEGLDLSKWARQRLLKAAIAEAKQTVLDASNLPRKAKEQIGRAIDKAVEDVLPDHPPKQKRDKDGLLPICERCKRLGSIGVDRNYNCPTCGGRA